MSTSDPEFERIAADVLAASQRKPGRFPDEKWTDDSWREYLMRQLRSAYRAGGRAQLSRSYGTRPDPAERLQWMADQGLLGEDLRAVLHELGTLREKADALTGTHGVTDSDIRSMLAEGFHTAWRKATDTPEAAVIHKLIRDMDPEEWGAVIDFVAGPLIHWLRKAQEEHEAQGETADG